MSKFEVKNLRLKDSVLILISLMFFIATIILTNDNIKEKIQTDKILSSLSIIWIIFIIVVVLAKKTYFLRKDKFK